MWNEKKYTEDSIVKQLALIQLHCNDGSAVDAGCGCIEGKHLHIVEGLAEEAIMTASNPKEKAFYENLANVARETRKAIEESKFDYMPHNPGGTNHIKYRCKLCGEIVEFRPEHLMQKHPEVKFPQMQVTLLKNFDPILDNPYPRNYEPHGLTECEKTHPKVLRKLARCIRKVEEREGCTPPYTDCPVNPVAVCRASVKCP